MQSPEEAPRPPEIVLLGVYDAEQAGRILRLTARTVNRWCQERKLKATLVGQRWLILGKHLLEFFGD